MVHGHDSKFTHKWCVLVRRLPLIVGASVHVVAVGKHLAGSDYISSEHGVDSMNDTVVKVLRLHVLCYLEH